MQRLENLETRADARQIAGAVTVDASERPTPAPDRWKEALKRIVAAAFRLHYYRSVRTRMLHEALSAARCDAGAGHFRPSSRLGSVPESPPESH